MKNSICRIKSFYFAATTLLLILLSEFSFAQPTFFASSSTPADGGVAVGPTSILLPPGGMVKNDLVVIIGEYRTGGAAITMGITGGQTWNTAVSNVTAGNTSASIFWCTFNGLWAANPTVTGPGANPQSAVMYVFRPTNTNSKWGLNVVAATTSSTVNPSSIASLTTTLPNTVTMAFWDVGALTQFNTLTGAGWSQAGLTTQVRNSSGG
jgi:hypothetical protein